MDAKAFFTLVASMRKAQKDYFRTRSQIYLRESKALEKRVDDEIVRVNDLIKRSEPKQQNLFQ